MTIKDCIDIVDNIKPNQYTIKDKVMWLSFIDEIIINEVLKTHEGYDGRYDDFEGYSEDKLSVPLVVPSPYDRLYTAYLKMKIDGENGETARYNNSAVLYNTYMLEYRRYYNKEHLPLNGVDKHKVSIPKRNTVGLSDAEYENLKRDMTYILTKYFSNAVSQDKLYDAVKSFVQNNIQMLKGKDGKDGRDGTDGRDGADGRDGRDGKTPLKGIDYLTDEEVEAFRKEMESKVEKVDGFSLATISTIVEAPFIGSNEPKKERQAVKLLSGENAIIPNYLSDLNDDMGLKESMEKTQSTLAYINKPYQYVDMSQIFRLIELQENAVTYAYGAFDSTQSDTINLMILSGGIGDEVEAKEVLLILDLSETSNAPTLSFLNNIKWFNNEPPKIEGGKVYMFSFIRAKKLGVLEYFYLGIGGEFV